MWQSIIGGILSLGKDWFERKKERQAAKHAVELKRLEQDSYLMEGSIKSWKDEWWTLIVSLPIVQLMMAPVVELILLEEPYQKGDWNNAVMTGLQALESVPEWHIYIATVSALFSFGIKPAGKRVADLIKNRGGKSDPNV